MSDEVLPHPCIHSSVRSASGIFTNERSGDSMYSAKEERLANWVIT